LNANQEKLTVGSPYSILDFAGANDAFGSEAVSVTTTGTKTATMTWTGSDDSAAMIVALKAGVTSIPGQFPRVAENDDPFWALKEVSALLY
jgi:hypothetical protein